jgi:flagellar basal-body rod modification protein FlgD
LTAKEEFHPASNGSLFNQYLLLDKGDTKMLTPELNSISTGSRGLAASKAPVLGKDDFLHLLITQLQNQDPLNPTDHTEFTAQLAQFSSLEQLNNVNDNLVELQNFQASTNNSQAVSLLGKEITTNGNFLQLTEGEPIECDFSLVRDAAEVVVSIYDSSGEFVKEFTEKNIPAGRQTLDWDGTDKDKNPVKAGNYTFEIQATDANDQTVKVTTFFTGTVDTVTFENNTPFLISGDQKIALGDVIQVAAPAH